MANFYKFTLYKVLGLDEFRWATRPEDLRRAYRSLILKYHPDKGKVKEVKGSDRGTVFACMTKAYEFLIQPKKRRSYDSFDPEFDDSLPSKKSYRATTSLRTVSNNTLISIKDGLVI